MAQKVYWLGRHANCPELGAPASKLHKAGLELLLSMGWAQVQNDCDMLPVFAFTTGKGANYSADKAGLPTIRQFPHINTACLDDKRSLHEHLHAAGQQQLLPPSWSSLDSYYAWLDKQPGISNITAPATQGHIQSPASAAAAQSGSSSSSSSSSMKLPGSVFIKHRRGVKGQAVYIAHTLKELQQLQQRLKNSSNDFIVQQEVTPMLLQSRKFVLRVHVLVTRSHSASSHVYVHKDVIVLKHACDYDGSSINPAVHISSRGSGHPTPFLLRELPALQQQIWPQLQQLVQTCIGAVASVLFPTDVHPEAVLYHLFGFDCMVDGSTGSLLLLEVNSYPAIASGTMSAVDVGVYTRLVADLVRLLVLPVTDGLHPQPGGFVEVASMLPKQLA